MSDALISNRPSGGKEVIHSLCNSHARRQCVDVISHFPEEVEEVLERYGKIWHIADEAEKKGLNAAERRSYHEKQSLPHMEWIRSWGNQHLLDETVEENSGLGKAISTNTMTGW